MTQLHHVWPGADKTALTIVFAVVAEQPLIIEIEMKAVFGRFFGGEIST